MNNKRLTIPVTDTESVSAVLTLPSKKSAVKKTGVITAHGAGNDMNNPLIVAFTDGMAVNGYPALRFNFPYREQGRRTPDGGKKLEHTWAAVYRYFTEHLSPDLEHVAAAGKSMGGRVASQMAARHELPVDGIIFLGYPLHPAGDHSRIKDAHLYQITLPLLFFAGTRDRLCDPDILKTVLSRLSVPWELNMIEGGDHSFHIPKSAGLHEADIFERIVAISAEWLKTTFAA
ncbi:MAG TPA: hypothetical protein ENN35_07615 [Deltaproteobacteria bacterium]|nr:hypothetical protein [Deltaproteobacteria bacterium]